QKYLSTLLKKDAHRSDTHPTAAELPRPAYHEPGQVITTLATGGGRHGDRRAEVLGIAITDEAGRPLEELRAPARIVVRVSVRAIERIELPIVGFLMRTEQGVDLAGTNTTREDVVLPPLEPGQTVTVDFVVRLPELAPARYTFTPGIADGTLLEFRLCDLVEGAASIRILAGPDPVFGYVHIPCVAVASPAAPRAAT
ncbi:MAG TPA: Wzt carbohydrate-binding domain-containing protein, partial [Bryobacteraceae bacterium]|nr:Wzt carbohydrate-binding domain-containing protein [Bryobacteraceae bacterium]